MKYFKNFCCNLLIYADTIRGGLIGEARKLYVGCLPWFFPLTPSKNVALILRGEER